MYNNVYIFLAFWVYCLQGDTFNIVAFDHGQQRFASKGMAKFSNEKKSEAIKWMQMAQNAPRGTTGLLARVACNMCFIL